MAYIADAEHLNSPIIEGTHFDVPLEVQAEDIAQQPCPKRVHIRRCKGMAYISKCRAPKIFDLRRHPAALKVSIEVEVGAHNWQFTEGGP